MQGDKNDPATRLLDATGQQAKRPSARICQRCGAGPERRVASAGFGAPHPVCSQCGHDFHGERME